MPSSDATEQLRELWSRWTGGRTRDYAESVSNEYRRRAPRAECPLKPPKGGFVSKARVDGWIKDGSAPHPPQKLRNSDGSAADSVTRDAHRVYIREACLVALAALGCPSEEREQFISLWDDKDASGNFGPVQVQDPVGDQPLSVTPAADRAPAAEGAGQGIATQGSPSTPDTPDQHPASPTAHPQPSEPSPTGPLGDRRGALAWVGALAAMATLVGLGFFLKSPDNSAVEESGSTTSTSRSDDVDSALGSQAPAPGEASFIVGFGDADGGRRTYPCPGTQDGTPTSSSSCQVPSTPMLNSLIDVPFGIGDERKFLTVRITPAGTAPNNLQAGSRQVRLAEGEEAWLRVYVHNSAAQQDDCTDLDARQVAEGVVVTGSLSRSTTSDVTVVRVWVEGDNTTPAWVTDAVTIESPSDLVYDSDRAVTYQANMEGMESAQPLQGDPFSGSVSIGDNGRIGSCWQHQLVLALPLTVGTDQP